MAADVELLPLPEPGLVQSEAEFIYAYDREDVEAYARANVSHATAAKDAEIEALRREVEAVWAAMPRDSRYLDPPDGGCVPLHEQVRRMAADATRAERMAEALRELVALGHPRDPAIIAAKNALRDHDQEVGNG